MPDVPRISLEDTPIGDQIVLPYIQEQVVELNRRVRQYTDDEDTFNRLTKAGAYAKSRVHAVRGAADGVSGLAGLLVNYATFTGLFGTGTATPLNLTGCSTTTGGRYIPDHWPPTMDTRAEQISNAKTLCHQVARSQLGDAVWEQCLADQREYVKKAHAGDPEALAEGPTLDWDHGVRGIVASPAWRREVLTDAFEQAKQGKGVLVICSDAYLHADQLLASDVHGQPADDTHTIRWWIPDRDGGADTEQMANFPKYRIGRGWVLLAPRERLAAASQWYGTFPDTVAAMPHCVDWFSLPFVLGAPTSETDT